jgi:hypothetical protein
MVNHIEATHAGQPFEFEKEMDKKENGEDNDPSR